ncbi:solute carrier family 2, facilitated glucose transporter member 5-like [Tiliqua scincoides]|uniref:solute carrier family 2, facilitated glucose transporter member 5-like n=1 Tax=Tiliqua scincoides TaxID=71010 RepID=UPI0034632892
MEPSQEPGERSLGKAMVAEGAELEWEPKSTRQVNLGSMSRQEPKTICPANNHRGHKLKWESRSTQQAEPMEPMEMSEDSERGGKLTQASKSRSEEEQEEPPKKQLSSEFFNKSFRHMTHFTDQQKRFRKALLVSFFSLGGLVGSLLVGILTDKCGRKGALVVNNLLSLISAIIMSSTNYMMGTFYYYHFSLLSRGITGICSGIFSIAVPMYLGEIAPQRLRGAIIMVAQLFVAFGVLVAQILGRPEILGTQKGWPLYLSFTGILAIFQLFLLPSFPESPRYLLIRKGKEEKARQALKMLRGQDDVEDEIEELQEEDIAEMPEKDITVFNLLCFRDLRWQLLSVIILMVGRELSGINAAYYYAELLFVNAAGITVEKVRYVSMGSTTVVIITLLITIFIIETVGRRTLLLTGFAICSITCILLTMSLELQATLPWMSYISLILILIFLTGHVMGPSPIPDVIVTELFFQSTRSSAFVVGGFVEWLCSFCTGFAFVYIKEKIGAYCFFVYWPFCVANFIYVFKIIPETTNRSFLDIRRIMTIHVLKIVMRKSKGSRKKFSRRATQRSIRRSKRRETLFP